MNIANTKWIFYLLQVPSKYLIILNYGPHLENSTFSNK